MFHKYIPALLILLTTAAAIRAEIAPESKEQLESKATHIVEGTATFVGTAQEKDGDWLKTGGVVEVKVGDVKKGKRIEPGDAVYARFWRMAWDGKGNPPPFGSGHHLPKKGDRVRVYLKQSNGGYDALLPNGIEVLENTK